MAVRTPYFRVRLAGRDITAWVAAVSVTEDDRRCDSVTLTVPDPHFSYGDALVEGCWAEVDLGYRERDAHAVLIRALLTKVEAQYPQNGVPVTTLSGEDKSIEMGLVERTRRWADTTVTRVVRDVSGPYRFSRTQVELSPDPAIRTQALVQDGKTDLAFLQELAEKYHAKCFVELDDDDREVLYFIPERRLVTTRRPDTLVLRFRAGGPGNLISFSPRFDSGYLDRLRQSADLDTSGEVVESPPGPPPADDGWPLDAALVARAGDADARTIRDLYEAGLAGRARLREQLAAARPTVGVAHAGRDEIDAGHDVREGRRLGMTASGSTVGNIWLRAKSLVRVDIPSRRWAGPWYVSSVTHRIDDNGFTTDFTATR
jgi:phage protein D